MGSALTCSPATLIRSIMNPVDRGGPKAEVGGQNALVCHQSPFLKADASKPFWSHRLQLQGMGGGSQESESGVPISNWGAGGGCHGAPVPGRKPTSCRSLRRLPGLSGIGLSRHTPSPMRLPTRAAAARRAGLQ